MSLNDKLKIARKRAGFTQEEVEKRTNINKKTISNWENGVSRPDVDSITVLCKLYDVNPNEIFEWETNNDNNSYYINSDAAELAQEMFDRPEMRVLFDASRKATKEDIEQVAEILKKLSGK